MLKKTNVAKKEKDKEAWKIYKKYGSVRKAANSDDWNASRSMLGRRKKRWELHLEGKHGYPELEDLSTD